MDRISFGDDKGRVFIVPALKFICAVFLDFNENEKEKFGDVLCLNGHSQAVTCIVHPHSEYPRYDVRHMLTGSLDQSIRLWDLTTQTESYVFNLHSGSILSLLIPPPMLNVTTKRKENVSFHEIEFHFSSDENAIFRLFGRQ